MKRLSVRLHRALLFVLALMPLVTALCRLLTVSVYTGAIFLSVQTALLAMITLLPAYIGNYREYEVVRYEGSRTSDPNPDREAVHTLVKEGHRFPLRLFADLTALLLCFITVFLLPKELFIGAAFFRRILFAALFMVMLLSAAHDLPSSVYIWEDIPGMVVGLIGYLAMAIYLHFANTPPTHLQWLIAACAVLYLFFGAVALNRQSIVLSMSAHSGEDRRIPKLIALRNRRIVITFATVVTVVSLIEPIRRGVVWLLRQFVRLFGLLKGAPSDMPHSMPFAAGTVMEAVPQTEQAAVAAQDMGGSNIVVYVFLGVIVVCLLFLLYEMIRKLSDKLTKWLERFAHNVSEGFYDEKEELLSADEMRDRLAAGLKRGLESLFKREKPWRELTGRERARRLMKSYYKKRAGKVENLRAKTAREVLSEGVISKENKLAFSEAYEAARYSDNEVSAEKMDAIKKDLRL